MTGRVLRKRYPPGCGTYTVTDIWGEKTSVVAASIGQAKALIVALKGKDYLQMIASIEKDKED